MNFKKTSKNIFKENRLVFLDGPERQNISESTPEKTEAKLNAATRILEKLQYHQNDLEREIKPFTFEIKDEHRKSPAKLFKALAIELHKSVEGVFKDNNKMQKIFSTGIIQNFINTTQKDKQFISDVISGKVKSLSFKPEFSLGTLDDPDTTKIICTAGNKRFEISIKPEILTKLEARIEELKNKLREQRQKLAHEIAEKARRKRVEIKLTVNPLAKPQERKKLPLDIQPQPNSLAPQLGYEFMKENGNLNKDGLKYLKDLSQTLVQILTGARKEIDFAPTARNQEFDDVMKSSLPEGATLKAVPGKEGELTYDIYRNGKRLPYQIALNKKHPRKIKIYRLNKNGERTTEFYLHNKKDLRPFRRMVKGSLAIPDTAPSKKLSKTPARRPKESKIAPDQLAVMQAHFNKAIGEKITAMVPHGSNSFILSRNGISLPFILKFKEDQIGPFTITEYKTTKFNTPLQTVLGRMSKPYAKPERFSLSKNTSVYKSLMNYVKEQKDEEKQQDIAHEEKLKREDAQRAQEAKKAAATKKIADAKAAAKAKAAQDQELADAKAGRLSAKRAAKLEKQQNLSEKQEFQNLIKELQNGTSILKKEASNNNEDFYIVVSKGNRLNHQIFITNTGKIKILSAHGKNYEFTMDKQPTNDAEVKNEIITAFEKIVDPSKAAAAKAKREAEARKKAEAERKALEAKKAAEKAAALKKAADEAAKKAKREEEARKKAEAETKAQEARKAKEKATALKKAAEAAEAARKAKEAKEAAIKKAAAEARKAEAEKLAADLKKAEEARQAKLAAEKAAAEKALEAKKAAEKAKESYIESIEKAIGHGLTLRATSTPNTYQFQKNNKDIPFKVTTININEIALSRDGEDKKEKTPISQIKDTETYKHIVDHLIKLQTAKSKKDREDADLEVDKTPEVKDSKPKAGEYRAVPVEGASASPTAARPIPTEKAAKPAEKAKITSSLKPEELSEKAKESLKESVKVLTAFLGKGVTIERQMPEHSNANHISFFITRDKENLPYIVQFNRRDFEKIRISRLKNGGKEIETSTPELDVYTIGRTEILKTLKKYIERTGSKAHTQEELVQRQKDKLKNKVLLERMPDYLTQEAQKVDTRITFQKPKYATGSEHFTTLQVLFEGKYTGVNVEIDNENAKDLTFSTTRGRNIDKFFSRINLSEKNSSKQLHNYFKTLVETNYPDKGLKPKEVKTTPKNAENYNQQVLENRKKFKKLNYKEKLQRAGYKITEEGGITAIIKGDKYEESITIGDAAYLGVIEKEFKDLDSREAVKGYITNVISNIYKDSRKKKFSKKYKISNTGAFEKALTAQQEKTAKTAELRKNTDQPFWYKDEAIASGFINEDDDTGELTTISGYEFIDKSPNRLNYAVKAIEVKKPRELTLEVKDSEIPEAQRLEIEKPADSEVAEEAYSDEFSPGRVSSRGRRLNVESLGKLRLEHMRATIKKIQKIANQISKEIGDGREIKIQLKRKPGTSHQTITIDGTKSKFALDLQSRYDATSNTFDTVFALKQKYQRTEYKNFKGWDTQYLKNTVKEMLDATKDTREVKNIPETLKELETAGVRLLHVPSKLTHQTVKDLRNAIDAISASMYTSDNAQKIENALDLVNKNLQKNLKNTEIDIIYFGREGLRLTWNKGSGFENPRPTILKIKKAQYKTEEEFKTFEAKTRKGDWSSPKDKIAKLRANIYTVDYKKYTTQGYTTDASISALSTDKIRANWLNIKGQKRVETALKNPPYSLSTKEVGLKVATLLSKKKEGKIYFSDVLKHFNFKNFNTDLLPANAQNDSKVFLEIYNSLIEDSKNPETFSSTQQAQLNELNKILIASIELLEAIKNLKFSGTPKQKNTLTKDPDTIKVNAGLQKFVTFQESGLPDVTSKWYRFKSWLTGRDEKDIDTLTMADMNGKTVTFDKGKFRRHYNPDAAIKMIGNTKGMYEAYSRPKKLNKKAVTREVNRLIALGYLNKFIEQEGRRNIGPDTLRLINELKEDPNNEKLKERIKNRMEKILKAEGVTILDIIKDKTVLERVLAKYQNKKSTAEILNSRAFQKKMKSLQIKDITKIGTLTEEQAIAFQMGMIIDEQAKLSQNIEEGKEMAAKHPAFTNLVKQMQAAGYSKADIEKVQSQSLGMVGIEFTDGSFTGAGLGKRFPLSNGKSFSIGLGVNKESGLGVGISYEVQLYEGETLKNSFVTSIGLVTPNPTAVGAGIGMHQTIKVSDRIDLHLLEGIHWSWNSVIPTIGGAIGFAWNTERTLQKDLEENKDASIFRAAWEKFQTLDKHDINGRYKAIMEIPQAKATFEPLIAMYGLTKSHIVHMVEDNEKDIENKVLKNENEPWYRTIAAVGIGFMGPIPIPTVSIKIGSSHVIIPHRNEGEKMLAKIADQKSINKVKEALKLAQQQSEADYKKFTADMEKKSESTGKVIQGKNGQLLSLYKESEVNIAARLEQIRKRQIQDIEKANPLYRMNQALEKGGVEMKLLHNEDGRMEVSLYNIEDKDVMIYVDPTLKNIALVKEGNQLYIDGDSRDLVITRMRSKLPYKGSRAMSSVRDIIIIRQKDSLRAGTNAQWIIDNSTHHLQKLENEKSFTIIQSQTSAEHKAQENIYKQGSETEQRRTIELKSLRYKKEKPKVSTEFIERHHQEQVERALAVRKYLLSEEAYEVQEKRPELTNKVKELFAKIEHKGRRNKLGSKLEQKFEAIIDQPQALARFIENNIDLYDLNEKEINYAVNVLRNLYFTVVFPKKNSERIKRELKDVETLRTKLKEAQNYTITIGGKEFTFSKEHPLTHKEETKGEIEIHIFTNKKEALLYDKVSRKVIHFNVDEEIKADDIPEIKEAKLRAKNLYKNIHRSKLTIQGTDVITNTYELRQNPIKVNGKTEDGISYFVFNNGVKLFSDPKSREAFTFDPKNEKWTDVIKDAKRKDALTKALKIAKEADKLPKIEYKKPETPSKSAIRRLTRRLKKAEARLSRAKQRTNKQLLRAITVRDKFMQKSFADTLTESYISMGLDSRTARAKALRDSKHLNTDLIYGKLRAKFEKENYNFANEEVVKVPEGARFFSGSRLYEAKTKPAKNAKKLKRKIEWREGRIEDRTNRIKKLQKAVDGYELALDAKEKYLNTLEIDIKVLKENLETEKSAKKRRRLRRTIRRIQIKHNKFARRARNLAKVQEYKKNLIEKYKNQIANWDSQIKKYRANLTVPIRVKSAAMSETVSYMHQDKEDNLSHGFGLLKSTITHHDVNDNDPEERERARAMLAAASPIPLEAKQSTPERLHDILFCPLALMLKGVKLPIALETARFRKTITALYKNPALLSNPNQEMLDAVNEYRDLLLMIRTAQHNGEPQTFSIDAGGEKVEITVHPGKTEVVSGAFSKCANASWYVLESVSFSVQNKGYKAPKASNKGVAAASSEYSETIGSTQERKDITLTAGVKIKSTDAPIKLNKRAPKRKTGTTRKPAKSGSTNTKGSTVDQSKTTRPNNGKSGTKGVGKNNTTGKA